MSVKLLTEHYLEFLSLKGGCRGSSEPTLVKMSIVDNLMPGSYNTLVYYDKLNIQWSLLLVSAKITNSFKYSPFRVFHHLVIVSLSNVPAKNISVPFLHAQRRNHIDCRGVMPNRE